MIDSDYMADAAVARMIKQLAKKKGCDEKEERELLQQFLDASWEEFRKDGLFSEGKPSVERFIRIVGDHVEAILTVPSA